ncbi:hypothetical protein OS125_09250 [Corynebacterium sp. P7003]|uniref:DUF6779 domain-containing protein n=1 Tax=Corynebacterium pygosceleis TaxID=2800406 RepID=A0ABT3WTA3_9CORY|nr:DUF6779 domain-containing protein [Corynebacterium pygosceleis]MCX7445421.1 hypothetical protein [Corynebacterium pygosceleis]
MSDADENATPSGTDPLQGEQQNDRWQVVLVVLVVLALIAVMVMLFTGSDVALKIGVVAALWAAVLGIILAARYRGQIAAERRDRERAERLHEEDLRREVAEHREQERILERSYLESLDDYRDTALAEIREQLEAMRAQLEELSGQTWSYEPAALQAEARRIQELLAGPGHGTVATGDDGASARTGTPRPEAEDTGSVEAEDDRDILDAQDAQDIQDAEEVRDIPETPTTDTLGDTVGAGDGARTGAVDPDPAGMSAAVVDPEAPSTVGARESDTDTDTVDDVDEDVTGAHTPISAPSWLTSPSALKPNPLITGEDIPGAGVPVDASYLITGGRGGRIGEREAVDASAGTHAAHGERETTGTGDSGGGFDTGAMAAVPWDATGRSASRGAAHAVGPDHRSATPQDAENTRHGRRRRDERGGGGISVAELLQNLRENGNDGQ